MLTIQNIDMTGFNAGLAGLARLGIPMSKVIRKETGELIKTLVKVSPPSDIPTTKQNIARNIAQRFEAASHADYLDSRTSPGAIHWTRHTKKFLYGVANELDWRSVSDLRRIEKLSYQLTPKGRRVVDFNKPRLTQRVSLSQRVYLQAGILEKLVKRLQGRIGRLKAGWMVAVRDGKVQLSGRYMPPRYVTKHVNSGTRGDYRDELSNQTVPAFIIINRAVGINQKGIGSIIRKALSIRAKAMAANAANYFKNKKNLADYAR